MTRWAALAFGLAACGGGEGGGGDRPACPNAGTLAGCLAYEAADCVGNTALDGLPGGWFDDRDGQLRIGLAPSDEGVEIALTVPEAVGLNTGAEYAIPTEVLVELWDRGGAEDTLYYACNGTLRITNYTPGELLWANFTFQARGPMGVCGEVDYWSVGAELINAGFCDAG